MKITVNKDTLIKDVSFKWNIEINYIEEGASWQTCKDNRVSTQISLRAGQLTASIAFSAHPDQPIRLVGEANTGDRILICNIGNRIMLYINETLADEDWPLGEAELNGSVCCEANMTCFIHDDFEFYEQSKGRFLPEKVTDIKSWRPAGKNTSIGDCMPFSHGGTYRLFYLYDRRHHNSKWGLGAHQWGQITTRDFKSWETCPMAISVDEQYEGSICTGSVIEHQGMFYAFYAVRMSDHSPAILTYATSRDCVEFEKSGESIVLQPPYEPVSARDPMVFAGEDGLFHMLVTTSVDGKGALAHLVSENLRKWTQCAPFITLDIADQPECADYFKFGDYYYLVYSNYGTAHYFYSKTPLGPWSAPEENIVIDKRLRVPKGAILEGCLIFAGFVLDEGVAYGGQIELYEAKQISKKDGQLAFQLLK